MKYIFLLNLLFVCHLMQCNAQDNFNIKYIDSLQQSKKVNELINKYSNNKVLIEDYKLPILTALSYFPELAETPIEIKYANINTTMNARPTFWTLLFREKGKRKYIIRVTNKSKKGSITLKSSEFNAQVGVLGHELSHIVDYEERNFLSVIKRLIDYTNVKRKEKFEKEIDRKTIEKGLGWQLLAWSRFVQEHSFASKLYKAFKANIYLESNEIMKLLEASE